MQSLNLKMDAKWEIFLSSVDYMNRPRFKGSNQGGHPSPLILLQGVVLSEHRHNITLPYLTSPHITSPHLISQVHCSHVQQFYSLLLSIFNPKIKLWPVLAL
jgi:hypothetical protein